MTEVTVSDKNMSGHKWVKLNIQVLHTTAISHVLPPREAIKLAEEIIKKAKELEIYNQLADDAKWEARGGYPSREPENAQ